MTDDHAPGEGFALSIDGEMTIYRAKELKEALLAVLARPEGPRRIDLSKVTELDSAGVQLLVLVRHLADRAGRELDLVGHSAAVREVLALFNLEAHLGAGPGAGLRRSGGELPP